MQCIRKKLYQNTTTYINYKIIITNITNFLKNWATTKCDQAGTVFLAALLPNLRAIFTKVSPGHNLPTIKMASLATHKLHWQQRRKPVQPNAAYLVQWAGMEEKKAVQIGKRALTSASMLQSVLSISRSSEHIQLQFQHWWQNVGSDVLLKASPETMDLDTKAGESSDEEGEAPDLKQDEQLEALKQCSESAQANAIRTLKELQAEAQVKEDIAKIEAGQTVAVLEDEGGQSKPSKPNVSVKTDYPKTVAAMLVDAGVLLAFFHLDL